MSIKILRLLIAFSVALAIPLQGVAAVTAGVCMAIGHHDAGAPGSDDHGGHDHHGDHAGPAMDHSTPQDEGSDSAHCAPCVACCAAASIAPAAQLFVAELSPPAAIAAVPLLHPGFLPEELDRPPLAL